MSLDEVHELTAIDPWFLDELAQIVELEEELRGIEGPHVASDEQLRRAKQFGFSDRQFAHIWKGSELEIRG
jgi:carbamoyl-phosphate synthase large subunit